MRPLPLGTIFLRTSWVMASVPKTLTSNSRRTRSMGTSAMGPVCPAPALLISTSMSQAATLDVGGGDVDPLHDETGKLGAQRLGLLVGLGRRHDLVTPFHESLAGQLSESGAGACDHDRSSMAPR